MRPARGRHKECLSDVSVTRPQVGLRSPARGKKQATDLRYYNHDFLLSLTYVLSKICFKCSPTLLLNKQATYSTSSVQLQILPFILKYIF